MLCPFLHIGYILDCELAVALKCLIKTNGTHGKSYLYWTKALHLVLVVSIIFLYLVRVQTSYSKQFYKPFSSVYTS